MSLTTLPRRAARFLNRVRRVRRTRLPAVEGLEGRALFAAVGSVSGLALVDAATDRDAAPLTAGATVDLSAVGSRLNVRADVAGPVGSVKFVLDGKPVRVESYAPLALFADDAGDYRAGTFAPGRHTIAATPFGGADGGGTAGPTLSVTFTVTSTRTTTPPPTTPFPTSISWSTRTRSPIPRAEAVGAVVGNKLYVMGGFDGTSTPAGSGRWTAVARCDVYDPATDRWKRLADMPEPFTHASGVVVGNTIWFVGGYVGNHPGPGTTRVWKYDAAANKWSRGPDLPEARGAGAAALVGTKIYYAAGMDATRTENRRTTWALNLRNLAAGWVQRASIPAGTNHLGAVGLNGKLYAVGGQLRQEEEAAGLTALQEYDPATNKWTTRKSLPAPRSHLTAGTFVYKGRLCIAGGDPKHDEPRREVFAWDPATNRWSVMGYLPSARATAVAGATTDGRIVVATGNGPEPKRTVWVGTPG